MADNYVKFLEDCLREQTKMTSLILAQLKSVREDLEHYKREERLGRFKEALIEREADRHACRSNSEEP